MSGAWGNLPGMSDAPTSGPTRAFNQVQAFQYVTVQQAPTYRAILQVFWEARQHYLIELRPEQVLERMREAGYLFELGEEETLDYHLGMLVGWGNLARAHDTASVARLEDYYRKRFLYHLTEVGEAAHRAVMEVEETVGRSGSLQASMLNQIRERLWALVRERDAQAAYHLLHDLYADFRTLTEEANRFIGELETSGAGQRLEDEQFEYYKRALLGYIGRFIDQLRREGDEIRSGIEALDKEGFGAKLRFMLPAAELPPAREGHDPAAAWLVEQLARWEGIRTWFLGGSAEPTVERLAEVARQAVLQLARSLGRLNDRQNRPIDRREDFRTLARWFAAAPSDREAHGIWYAAFGLASARHFHLAEEDADAASPGTSWWEAEPVEVPVLLREKGRSATTGRAGAVPDRSEARRWLEYLRRKEREQMERAVQRFEGKGPLSIEDIGKLEVEEFDLFLRLLDQALGAPRDEQDVRSVMSLDGQLQVRLHPPAGRDLVCLPTAHGVLRVRNYRIEVERTMKARPTLKVTA